ncbi:hypothetical protein Sjap_026307 [Stephania japonica]|uniref:Cysteine protease n=1 Tax=Stephania japonica TaxID=461633 RepID=A0AAP0E3F1_9MAGN
MLRSSQMLVAQALLFHCLGRSWRRPLEKVSYLTRSMLISYVFLVIHSHRHSPYTIFFKLESNMESNMYFLVTSQTENSKQLQPIWLFGWLCFNILLKMSIFVLESYVIFTCGLIFSPSSALSCLFLQFICKTLAHAKIKVFLLLFVPKKISTCAVLQRRMPFAYLSSCWYM